MRKRHKHFYTVTQEGSWMVWQCKNCKDVFIMLRQTWRNLVNFGWWNPQQIAREHRLGMLATGRKMDRWPVRKLRERRLMKSWSTSDAQYLSNRRESIASKASASATGPML